MEYDLGIGATSMPAPTTSQKVVLWINAIEKTKNMEQALRGHREWAKQLEEDVRATIASEFDDLEDPEQVGIQPGCKVSPHLAHLFYIPDPKIECRYCGMSAVDAALKFKREQEEQDEQREKRKSTSGGT